MLFGSHLSVAGGLHRAISQAIELKCDCVQIFTKNNNQWACKPLDAKAIDAWVSAYRDSKLQHAIAHTSYLINVASPDDALRQKSVDALVVELERANAIGLQGLVLHPGAFTTSCESDGIVRVIESLVATFSRVPDGPCRLLLENTAGQGTCLGHSLEQLESIVQGVNRQLGRTQKKRLGLCIDTCHALAAGYEITTARGLKSFRGELEDRFRKGFVVSLHLNDSKKPLGSHVDRHEHIGHGCIGLDGFRRLVRDPFFSAIPGYLETDKGTDESTGEDWDVVNLRVLRSLC